MSARKSVRILSICDDDGIRLSRELVLRQEGYAVESVTSIDTLEPAQIRGFHIAILCHTLTPAGAAELAARLRQENPSIRILRVHSIQSRRERFYDVSCEVLAGPEELLTAIQSLLPAKAAPNAVSDRKMA